MNIKPRFRNAMLQIAFTAGMVFLLSPAMSKTAQETSKLKEADRIIQEGLDEKVFPGAVLIVGKPGQQLWAKAYGRFTYDTTSPAVKLNTIFDLASVSKVAGTATAAMVLYDQKKLKLDRPVSEVVPWFETADKKAITIKDLLTHVSGMPSYDSKDKVEKFRNEKESHADALIRHYATLPLKYETRTSTTYSCLNMQIMARVNENLAGRRQEDLLEQYVYGPLGMKDTVYTLSKEQKNRCIPTVTNPDGSLLVAEVHDPLANYHKSDEHCPGNAGLFSTGPDLARLCEMYLNGGSRAGKSILKKSTVELMTQNHMPDSVDSKRGLGWDIYEEPPYANEKNQSPDTSVIGHTGYTGTLIVLDKRTKTYFVLLTNRTYPDDKSKKGRPTISSVRKDIAEVVLNNVAGDKESAKERTGKGD